MYKDLLQARRSGFRIPVGANFPHLFRLALGSTQPPVEWIPGLGGELGRGVALTNRPIMCRG